MAGPDKNARRQDEYDHRGSPDDRQRIDVKPKGNHQSHPHHQDRAELIRRRTASAYEPAAATAWWRRPTRSARPSPPRRPPTSRPSDRRNRRAGRSPAPPPTPGAARALRKSHATARKNRPVCTRREGGRVIRVANSGKRCHQRWLNREKITKNKGAAVPTASDRTIWLAPAG